MLCINDIPQALQNNQKYVYADGTSVFYQQKGIREIENGLNKGFANVSKWFIDNKQAIHFGEDKT